MNLQQLAKTHGDAEAIKTVEKSLLAVERSGSRHVLRWYERTESVRVATWNGPIDIDPCRDYDKFIIEVALARIKLKQGVS